MSEIRITMGGRVLSIFSEDQELAKIYADHLIPTENRAASDFAIHLSRLNGRHDPAGGEESWHTFRCGEQKWRSRRIPHGMEVLVPAGGSFGLSGVVSIISRWILVEGYYALAKEESRGDDLFLHGAGIIDRDGMGYAFAGPSGSGKTTMASLRPEGFQVVHDELLLVSNRNGKRLLSGGPIRGNFSVLRGEFPLGAVFLLSHGRGMTIRRLKGSEAVLALLPALVPPSFYHRTWGEFITSYYQLAWGLVGCVPVYSLSFYPHREVWDRVMEQIERDRSSVIARSGATKQSHS